jgi:methyl-accepting chemotaxis protein
VRETTPQKRRTVLIKREFQLGFIARLIGLVLLGGVLAGCGLWFAVGMELQAYSYRVHKLGSGAEGSVLVWIILVNGLMVLLVSGAAAWVSLYTLHRVAGPLARLEGVVRSIGGGNLDVVTTLRRNDEFQDFPVALGQMAASLAERVERLRVALRGVGEGIADLEDGESRVPQVKLARLRDSLAAAESVSAEFRTPPIARGGS